MTNDDRTRPTLTILVLLCAFPVASQETPSHRITTAIDGKVDDFTLQDFRGKWHELSDYDHCENIVLVFLGTECPLAKLYGPRLSKLAADYDLRGVAVLGINSNRQDSVTELVSYARQHDICFPMLKDVGNRVADQLGARRTPEVYVLDRDRRIQYHGRVDDQYGVGYAHQQPGRHDLREALESLLAGQPLAIAETPIVGCQIGRVLRPVADSSVTYANQISRILNRYCVECHRAGEIAPFSLTQYDELSGWAETIAEVIRDGRMPPWNANPKHGSFRSARRMTDVEEQLIYDWVDSGAPLGNTDDLPEPPEFVAGWRLPRRPDMVIAMSDEAFEVPAEGAVEYQYFVVDPGFERDHWVSATEVVPGNRTVVHHAIVFVKPPGASRWEGLGWLGAYVPGQRPMILPHGKARLIPAGSKLIFQMHYTPNGSVQSDITKVGIIFTEDNKVKEQTITLIAVNRDFEIPPHAANHLVRATLKRFPPEGKLLAVSPHMHVRGKSFKSTAHKPDGTTFVLADIPKYDFNWQHVYEFESEIGISEGWEIECQARFDNSTNNLANPDPTATVRWGDQTWEEMAIAFFEVAVPREHDFLRPKRNDDAPTTDQRKRAREKSAALFRRFDADRNRRIVRNELPTTTAVFGFHKLDRNDDDVITPEECEQATLDRLRQDKLPF